MQQATRSKRQRIPCSKYAGEEWQTTPAEDNEDEAAEPEDSDDEDAGSPRAKKKPRRRAPAPAPAAAPRTPKPPAAAAPRPRVSPKQRRQQQLTAALAERGLVLRADSRLCAEYIQTGRVLGLGGTADEKMQVIVNIMDQMRFYHAHTKYQAYREKVISDEMHYRGRFDTDEVSELAQGSALEEWASRFTSLQEAAARPELPASLVHKVLQMRWPIEPEDTEPELSSSPSPSRSWEDDRYYYGGKWGRY